MVWSSAIVRMSWIMSNLLTEMEDEKYDSRLEYGRVGVQMRCRAAGRTSGCVDRRTDGRTDERMDGRSNGRTDERTDERTDGRTDGRAYDRK